ncbi:hypothetical protein GCM10010533_53050 [Mycolicibacterium pallens]
MQIGAQSVSASIPWATNGEQTQHGAKYPFRGVINGDPGRQLVPVRREERPKKLGDEFEKHGRCSLGKAHTREFTIAAE